MRLIAKLVLAASVAGCAHAVPSRPEDAPSLGSGVSASRAVVTSDSPSETGYVATRVVQHLLRLAALRRPPPSVQLHESAGVFTLRLGPETSGRLLPLPLEPSVFSPEAWLAVAEALGMPAAVVPAAAHPVAAVLVDLEAGTTERENLRVSAALVKSPGDPLLHEQAALVLGAWLLQEEAGRYTDPRDAVARMTAHLTWARRLRSGTAPSTDGAIAATLLSMMCGRQVEALAQVAGWEKDAAPWATAIRLLVQRDWRTIPPGRPGTALEQVARQHVLRFTLGSSAAEAQRERDQADWSVLMGRLVLSHDPSVADARLALGQQAVLEARCLADAWLASRPAPAPRDVTDARVWAEEDPGFRVISWEAWRDMLARQAALLGEQTDIVYRVFLGMEDAADEVSRELDATHGALRLWPAVIGARGAVAAGHYLVKPVKRDCAAVSKALKTLGVTVAPMAWEAMNGCGLSWQEYPFQEGFPRGTAFDDLHRASIPSSEHMGLGPQAALHARALAEMAPYSRGVRWFTWTQSAESSRATLAAATQALSPLVETDVRMVDLLWGYARPEEQLEVLERGCALDLERCYMVAVRMLAYQQGKPIPILERMRREGRNKVLMANQLGLLVDAYADAGDFERAEELAEELAAVGSARGIATKADLLERRGRYVEAAAVHQRVVERYGDPSLQEVFSIRVARRTKGRVFAKEGQAAELKLFGGPVKKVTLGELKPTDAGFRATAAFVQTKMTRFGFRVGDVILAFDGYRLTNEAQFAVVRWFNDQQTATAFVVRDGKVTEIQGPFVRARRSP